MFHVKHLNNELLKNIANDLFLENQNYNLTGLKTLEDIWVKHFEDSLVLAEYIEKMGDFKNICDIGTGAGLPAMVLAVSLKQSSVFAVDSTNKKVAFIAKIKNIYNIENLFPFCDRAETFATSKLNYFDIVTARSLARLDVLLEYASPLLKKDGFLLAMKSVGLNEELDLTKITANIVGMKLYEIYEYTLAEQKRYIVTFRKVNEPQVKLPRGVGMAKNSPLKRRK